MSVSSSLPPEIAQLAAQQQLGTFIAEYRPRLSNRSVLGCGIMLVGGVVLFFVVQSQPDAPFWGAYLAFGFCALVGLAIVGSFLINLRLRVYVWASGFIRAKGHQLYVRRWDHISSIRQNITRHYTNGVYTGTTHVYTLLATDGTSVTFREPLGDIDHLGTTLVREITRVQLPKAIAAYNAGERLQFGGITVSKEGIGNGKETLPWSQVKDIQVNKGYVSVKKEGKWLNWSSAPVAAIPNFFVFLPLVKAIREQQRQ